MHANRESGSQKGPPKFSGLWPTSHRYTGKGTRLREAWLLMEGRPAKEKESQEVKSALLDFRHRALPHGDQLLWLSSWPKSFISPLTRESENMWPPPLCLFPDCFLEHWFYKGRCRKRAPEVWETLHTLSFPGRATSLINNRHREHLLSTHYVHGGADCFTHPLSHLILSASEVHAIIITNIVILRTLAVKKSVYLKLFSMKSLNCFKAFSLALFFSMYPSGYLLMSSD